LSDASENRHALPDRAQLMAGKYEGVAVLAAVVLLVAALAVLLFWQGGVSQIAVAVALALVTGAWIASWMISNRRPLRARFGWLWLGLGLYSTIQLLPLPRAMVAWLHPRAVEISDLGRAAVGLDPLSMLPIAISSGDASFQTSLYLLAGAFALTLARVLMAQDGRRVAGDISRGLLVMVVISAVLFLIVHEPSLRSRIPSELVATLKQFIFINPNHQACVMSVGLAIALGHVVETRRGRVQTIVGIVCVFLGLCILLTGSRGAILSAFFILSLTGATLPRPSRSMRQDQGVARSRSRRRLLLQVLSIVVVMVVITLPITEVEFGLVETSKSDQTLKLQMIKEALATVPDGWQLGQGPGSLPVVISLEQSHIPVRPDYAENLVAQRLIDCGIVPGLAFLFVLFWLVGSLIRLKHHHPGYTMLWIALCGMLIHNLVDFSMEIGGGLLCFMLVATLAERTRPKTRSPADAAQQPVKKRRVSFWRGSLGPRLASGCGLLLCGLLLSQSQGRLTRQTAAVYAGLDVPAAVRLTADLYPYHHHAFYLLGRKMLAQGQNEEAKRVLDRAVELRPASMHALLFRFSAGLEAGDDEHGVADVKRLIKANKVVFERMVDLCMASERGERVLSDAIGEMPERAARVGSYLLDIRPDYVEALALLLRKLYPDRRYGIDSQRGWLYVKRGLFKQAAYISTMLMSRPETELEGWLLEGWILAHSNQPYPAHHLFREVCDRKEHHVACRKAITTLLEAKRPGQAIKYIRSRYTQMRSNPVKAALYWRSMAGAYLQLERIEDAISAADRALGFVRDDHSAMAILVTARLALGDRRGASRMVERMQASSPDNKRVVELARQVSAATNEMGF
jgi:tetratricopeptide (TPR) repeat protein